MKLLAGGHAVAGQFEPDDDVGPAGNVFHPSPNDFLAVLGADALGLASDVEPEQDERDERNHDPDHGCGAASRPRWVRARRRRKS